MEIIASLTLASWVLTLINLILWTRFRGKVITLFERRRFLLSLSLSGIVAGFLIFAISEVFELIEVWFGIGVEVVEVFGDVLIVSILLLSQALILMFLLRRRERHE